MILTDWTRCLQAESVETEKPGEVLVARAHPWRGYFFIAAATLCWGAAAAFGKAVFSGSLFAGRSLISPLILSQTRVTFAVLVLLVSLSWRYGREFFRISGRDLVLCILIGTLGIAGSNYFYYVAIQKTTVAVAIILQYTSPIWVLLYMVLRGRQRATVERITAVLLAMVGVALAIGLFRSDIRLNTGGVTAAMVAAFSFSFYIVTGQRLVTRNHQLKVMTYTLLGAAVLWLVVNPPWRLIAQHYSVEQWVFLFLFSCFSILLPYIFYFTGLKYLDPTRAVVTSCLEPVFAILFAVSFLNETLRGMQALGIVAVLAATVMVQRGK